MLVPKAIKSSKRGSKERLNEGAQPSPSSPPIVVLPAMAVVSPHSNRHEVNPAMALKLLKDIEQSVLVWQAKLRRVVSAIEALHAQGPMVDGWLDSSVGAGMSSAKATHDTETTLLRHGDLDALMRYVEALESKELGEEMREPLAVAAVEEASCATRAQYRLCWLDDEGKVCSQACPPEQMAVVSSAIARYKKCKQLLAQRQALETHLQATVDRLTGVRNATQQLS